jgi:hypothetical protein
MITMSVPILTIVMIRVRPLVPRHILMNRCLLVPVVSLEIHIVLSEAVEDEFHYQTSW